MPSKFLILVGFLFYVTLPSVGFPFFVNNNNIVERVVSQL